MVATLASSDCCKNKIFHLLELATDGAHHMLTSPLRYGMRKFCVKSFSTIWRYVTHFPLWTFGTNCFGTRFPEDAVPFFSAGLRIKYFFWWLPRPPLGQSADCSSCEGQIPLNITPLTPSLGRSVGRSVAPPPDLCTLASKGMNHLEDLPASHRSRIKNSLLPFRQKLAQGKSLLIDVVLLRDFFGVIVWAQRSSQTWLTLSWHPWDEKQKFFIPLRSHLQTGQLLLCPLDNAAPIKRKRHIYLWKQTEQRFLKTCRLGEYKWKHEEQMSLTIFHSKPCLNFY